MRPTRTLRSRNSSEARHEPGQVVMSKQRAVETVNEGTKESGCGRGRTGGEEGDGGETVRPDGGVATRPDSLVPLGRYTAGMLAMGDSVEA